MDQSIPWEYLCLRLMLLNRPDWLIFIPATFCALLMLMAAWGQGVFRRRWVRFGSVMLVIGFVGAVVAHAAIVQVRAYFLLKSADQRIASIRKAPAQISIVDAEGNPIPGATVRVEQRRHAFLFGCNAFRLIYRNDGTDSAYAARFSAVFNYATLPFYWGLYEPEKGNTSDYTIRNKRVAQWCKGNRIETKGHPLIWHDLHPNWAPTEPDAAQRVLRERVNGIISEFKPDIRRWEVVNEATVAAHYRSGVGNWARRDGAAAFVKRAFEWAHQADPDAQLIYNDFNVGSRHKQLLDELINNGAPMDIIGIQSHMHRREWSLPEVWDVCADYAKFGKPLHFTEVTVLSGKHGWELRRPWRSTPKGEQVQAEYVERLYTILFSHPAVQAISWWDLDDGEWQGAPSGLVREDLSPKPAYDRLLKLIRETWWTRETLTSDTKGLCTFTGFLGDYEVTTQKGAISRTIRQSLVKGTNHWSIILGEPFQATSSFEPAAEHDSIRSGKQ